MCAQKIGERGDLQASMCVLVDLLVGLCFCVCRLRCNIVIFPRSRDCTRLHQRLGRTSSEQHGEWEWEWIGKNNEKKNKEIIPSFFSIGCHGNGCQPLRAGLRKQRACGQECRREGSSGSRAGQAREEPTGKDYRAGGRGSVTIRAKLLDHLSSCQVLGGAECGSRQLVCLSPPKHRPKAPTPMLSGLAHMPFFAANCRPVASVCNCPSTTTAALLPGLGDASLWRPLNGPRSSLGGSGAVHGQCASAKGVDQGPSATGLVCMHN